MDTEAKFKSVEAQVELVVRRQLSKFKCPYCGENAPLEVLCCEMLARAVNTVLDNREAARLGESKIQIIEEKIREAESTNGESSNFTCPFCFAPTRIANGEKYCCQKFYQTWQAIAERLTLERNTRKFEEIAEQVEKVVTQSMGRPLVTLD